MASTLRSHSPKYLTAFAVALLLVVGVCSGCFSWGTDAQAVAALKPEWANSLNASRDSLVGWKLPKPIVVQFKRGILDSLNVLSHASVRDDLEDIRCLLGIGIHTNTPQDTIYIEGIFRPHIQQKTPNNIKYDRCPTGAMAVWHTPPPDDGRTPEEMCYLSSTDIASALRTPWAFLQYVQPVPGLLCYWLYPQIFVGRYEERLAVPEGQIWRWQRQ